MASLPLYTSGVLCRFGSGAFVKTVSEAIAAYRRRFGADPDVCYLRAGQTALKDGGHMNGLCFKFADNISPNYLWVARESKCTNLSKS